MDEVIEKVMRTYALMVTLTPAKEQAARERLTQFLKDQRTTRVGWPSKV